MLLDNSRYLKDERQSTESAADKFQRAAYELGSGTALGFTQEFEKTLDDPREAIAKFGLSMAAGVGLAVLQRNAGLGKLAAEAAAFSMGCAFLTDVTLRANSTASALAESYRGGNADYTALGRFAFDTSLMTAGALTGIVGHRLAAGGFSRTPPTEVSNHI